MGSRVGNDSGVCSSYASANFCGWAKVVALQSATGCTPTMENLTPVIQEPYRGRMSNTSVNVLGLSLTCTRQGFNYAVDQFASAWDAARELLLE